MNIANLDGYFEEINEIIEELKENRNNMNIKSFSSTNQLKLDMYDRSIVGNEREKMEKTIEDLKNRIVELEYELEKKNLNILRENAINGQENVKDTPFILSKPIQGQKPGCSCELKGLHSNTKTGEDVTNVRVENMQERIKELENDLSEKDKMLILMKNEYEKSINNLNKTIEKYITDVENLKLKLKKARDELNDINGNIRVFCRIKPVISKKAEITYDECSLLICNSRTAYQFDKIFDWKVQQESIYNEFSYLLESAFEGYQLCIFAYGQTGSGKTYTIEGTDDDRGLNYRLLNHFFIIKKALEEENWSVEISCTYIEIYNEQIYDLFSSEDVKFGKLDILHKDGSSFINGVKENKLNDLKSSYDSITLASKNRTVGSTMSNDRSSRSHSLITYKIYMKNNHEERKGSLCLIDLAGSERLDSSQSEGVRLKETQFINKSLSNLGNVFTAILNKDAHIPFRNSTLTYFLQSMLTGNSRVVFILNISPE